MHEKMNQVKLAMLSVIRFPWEHGTALQAIYETGDLRTTVAMAHDAMLRQKEDGRLAVINKNYAVTDPASNGEGVYRAYEITKEERYKESAEKMLNYLLNDAPRTDNGTILHNEISFNPEFSEKQLWVDSLYMAPPFIAVMGEVKEAVKQIDGLFGYLSDDSGLLNHIYDAGTKSYVRKLHWASGNGWALLGLMRVIHEADIQGYPEEMAHLKELYLNLLNTILKYQLPDGRFHDIFDDDTSFIEGTAAMMMAASIYMGIHYGYISEDYLKNADLVLETMENYVDDYGILHEVCGCPHFNTSGTSCESMAAYLMMHAWKIKLEK